MKLHLPKALLVAVLSVFTALSASAFGPTDVTYTEVTGDVNSAQTPSADTFYSGVTGPFDISGSGYDIKLEGKNSDYEYVLGNITADSTWLSDSRFTINSSNSLAKAGDLYINGGACLQVLGEVKLTNDITLGTSTYNGGWTNTYANIKNAALLLGFWNNTDKSVTISGALDVQEDARIALQYGYELNHTGKLTGSADLNISYYTEGDKSSTVTLSGETDYTGNISLTGYSGAVLTLKLTTNTFKLQKEAASIVVGSNTVLDLSDYNTGWAGGRRNIGNLKDLNDNSKITTTGSGYILLEKENSELTLPGNSELGSEDAVNITSINKNYKVEGSLNINGAGYNKDDGRTRTLIVGDDRSFVTTGALSLVSNAVLKIEGGTVQAGSIALGHGTYYTQPYWGKIEMSGGSLKTGTITMQQSFANVVDISGGTLEFTQANAINVATNKASTVKIVGEDASNRVTLKTGSTAWHLNGAGLKEALVGNVTIDANNARAITLSNVQLTGNIVNNATLTLGENINVISGATLTIGGTGTTTVAKTITNKGTLQVNGGSVVFNGLLSGNSNCPINLMDGVITLNNTDAINDVWKLDIAGPSDSPYKAQVTLAQNVKLQVNDNMWLGNKAQLILEKDAQLIKGDMTIKGTGSQSAITRFTSGDNNKFGYGNSGYNDHEISNAIVDISATTDKEIALKLSGTELSHVGSGTLTVSNTDNTISKLSATRGNVTLSNSMTVESISAAQDKTITVNAGMSINMAGGVRISTTDSESDATMVAKSDQALLGIIQTGSLFSIADMTLTNASISATSEEVRVNLYNVSGSATLEQGTFMTEVSLTAVDVPKTESGSTSYAYSTGALSGITLNNAVLSGNTDPSANIVLNLGGMGDFAQNAMGICDISITLTGFSVKAVDIKGIYFAADSWLGQLLAAQGADAYVKDSILSVAQVYNLTDSAAGSTNVSVGVTETGSDIVINITGLDMVPEPTTTTLSLLALTALAARRRRK